LPIAPLSFNNSRMRIALITPHSLGPIRGNITTVRRIAAVLTARGITTQIFPVDTLEPQELRERLAAFAPTLLHAFHALHGGTVALAQSGHLHIPFMITTTGSDMHEPLYREQPALESVLGHCARVVCFDAAMAAQVSGFFPATAGRIAIVPQGVEPLDVLAGESYGLEMGTFNLLLPAALRPAKNIEFALRALAPLASAHPLLRLVIAGGVIDSEYGARVQALLPEFPFATWLGEVPHQRMGTLYTAVQAVINCSYFESMPNSLLEAMVMGKAILAADIPGNRALIRHGTTGLLYKNESDFRHCVSMLAAEPVKLSALGERAADWVRSEHSPEQEAAKYHDLYREITRA
jgi:glycosyltransferase involved in cell wall biosynthesis